MVATGTRRGNLIYHWKHGWIPLDHFAALSKAKGSHRGAEKLMHQHNITHDHKEHPQPVARGDLRRSPHISAVHAPGGNVVVRDSKSGHAVRLNTGHAASLHSQGHTITAVHEHGITTRSDSGVVTKRGLDTRAVEDHARPSAEVSAPGSWTTRQMPDGSFSVHGKDGTELGRVRLVTAGKHKGQWEGRMDGRHGADHAASPNQTIDAMYDSLHGQPGAAAQARAGGSPEERRLAAYKAAIRQHQARAAELTAAADKKRAEADRIANGVGAPDRAGAMLRAKDSARMNQRMDGGLRRYTETQRQARALESKAHLAEGRAKSAAEKQAASSLSLNASKVSPGDMIAHKGSAHMVTKVNRTTVSIPSVVGGPWEDKIPLGQVSKHVKVADMKESTLRTLMSKAKDNAALQAVYAAELKRRGLPV